FKSAPLFLLDDVDVALDNTNIGKVADFIREQSASKFQCIVISLKEQFYSRAGALTTIFPKPGDCITSYCFTLGLNQFDERENIANRRVTITNYRVILIKISQRFLLEPFFLRVVDEILSHIFQFSWEKKPIHPNLLSKMLFEKKNLFGSELSEKNHLPRLYRLYLPSDMEVDTREFFIELSRIFNCQTEEIDAHSAAAFSYEQYNKDK
ncbi:unnamed protein product, partial [Rotaria magnacalcarata]